MQGTTKFNTKFVFIPNEKKKKNWYKNLLLVKIRVKCNQKYNPRKREKEREE